MFLTFKGYDQNPEFDKYRHLLEKIEHFSSTGHWYVDLSENKVYWSSEVFRIHGLKPNEIEPDLETAINAYHPDDRDMVREHVETSIKTKKPFDFTARLKWKDGTIRHVKSSGECELDDKGNVTALFGVFQDITDLTEKERESERARRFLQNIINTIPDLVFVKDKDLKIVMANRALLDFYQMPAAKIIGTTTFENLPVEEVKALKDNDLEAFTTGLVEREEIATNAQGRTVIFHAHKQAFEDEKGDPYLLCVCKDITLKKKNDEILRKIYQISSDKGFSLGARVNEILRLSCDYYDMSYGIVSQIRNDNYTVMYAYSADSSIRAGMEMPLENTYCARFYKTAKPHAIEDMGKSEYSDLPAYKKMGLRSYITAPLYVESEIYGTINFSEKDGRTKPFSEDEQSFIRMISQWVGHEITQDMYLKRLKNSEERFALAAKGSSSALWDWDIESDTIHWSGLTETILGLQNINELPQTSLEFIDFIHADDHEKLKSAMKQHFSERLPFEIELRVKKPDGSYIWTFNRAQATWDFSGRAIRMSGSIIDVTDRKRVEQELLRSNKELEQYASVVSHDLHQPLRAVNGFLELLQLSANEKLSKKEQSYIHDALSSSTHLSNLINDLLEYARFSDQENEIEHFETNEVMYGIMNMMDTAYIDLDIDFSCSPLPAIHYDRSQFERLMTNLVDNAVKYTAEGNMPKIAICAEDMADHWLFSVQDSGIGIPQDKIEKIFDMFSRVRDKKEAQGTGLGLSICRRIVENHDGKIWAESQEGRGTTFFFTIPK